MKHIEIVKIKKNKGETNKDIVEISFLEFQSNCKNMAILKINAKKGDTPVKNSTKNVFKVLNFLKIKLLIVVFVIFLRILITIIHIQINPKNDVKACLCIQENIPLKLYISIKYLVSGYYLNSIFLYKCLFPSQNITQRISLKILLFIIFTIFYVFVSFKFECEKDYFTTQIYVNIGIVIPSLIVIFVAFFLSIKNNFGYLMKEMLIKLMFLCFGHIYLMIIPENMHLLKKILEKNFSKNISKNLFILFTTIYSSLGMMIYKYFLIKFSQSIDLKKYGYNSIVFFAQCSILLTISFRIAVIVQANISWGFIYSCISIINFSIKMHTGFSIYINLVKKIYYRIVYKKKFTFSLPTNDIIFKIYSFCHLEFLFFYIPNILLIIFWRIWFFARRIDNNIKNCQLQFKDELKFNLIPIIIYLSIHFIVTVISIGFIIKNNIYLLKFNNKRINYFYEIFIIIQLISFFELLLSRFLELS